MRKLLLLMLMCSPAFAQYSQRQATVFQSTGKPANQATVTVCASTDTTCVTPITVYSSSTGAAKANPFSTDTVGNYSFFQQTGYYTVKETYLGSSYTYKILLADTVHCVSPVEFGAVIDGTTNDTVAIQAAHDYSVAHGFTNVCFPSGTYKVSSALTWSPYIQAISLGRVILTTALASGTFVSISDQYGKPTPDPNATSTTRSKTFTGQFYFQNTNAANSTRAMFIGGATNANYASEMAIDGLNITGFKGGVFQFGYNAFLIQMSNIMTHGNPGSNIITWLPGATNSGENISFVNSVLADVSGGTSTAYLMSINSILAIDLNFVNCSVDYLLGVNDPAQTAALAQAHFTNVHFEWDELSAAYINLNNGIQVKIVNAKFFTTLTVGFHSPFVGQVNGASLLSVINGRYEFGGTVAKLYDLGSAAGTLELDADVSTANAVTTYYTYNVSGRLITVGRDAAVDIEVGDDLASTNFVGKNFTTAQSAANVPSEMDYGIKDGGVMNGIKVKSVRDGAFNSQSLEFSTQHGGVSVQTAMILDKDGKVTIGAGSTPILKYIEGTVTVDLASVAANTCNDTAGITVTGAVDGDVAIGSALAAIASTAGLQISAYVSAANTAKVRVCNVTVGAIDPPSTTYRVGVWVH